MEQYAQKRGPVRALIAVDWMVLAVAAFALALLILTMVRTGEGSRNSVGAGGLITLEDHDTLVAFQDFSFGDDGWDRDQHPTYIASGLGPVLVGSADRALERVFVLPENTTRATIRFDLFLNGGWGEEDTIRVVLGDVETLTLTWPSRADEPITSTGDGLSVAAHSVLLDGSQNTDPVARYSVELVLSAPADHLMLRLEPAVANGAQPNWAIDNVSVVARRAEA